METPALRGNQKQQFDPWMRALESNGFEWTVNCWGIGAANVATTGG
jgi:hypothetical protein